MADEINRILDELGLTQAERERLAQALGVAGPDDPGFAERLLKLRTAALKEVAGWIIGKTRYSSVSENDMHRVIELFLKIRQEAPSVDQLVSELTIPAARATSLLGRIRYGEGRELTALALTTSAARLSEKLREAQIENGTQTVWIDSDTLSHVRHVAMLIMMSDPKNREKNGKFEKAQFPDFTSYGRDGGTAKTTPKMWEYIVQGLQQGAQGL
jgi:hypothetical protein